MITFLQGVLVEKQPTRAVVDVGGVGYETVIPLSSYDRLPAVGQSVRILTHDHVREDQHVLFGFMTEAERAMFGLLLGVNGVGPKLALSALSGMAVRDLKTAVVEGDVKRLSSISGIGRKTAERMIVDLRHRIGPAEALEAVAGSGRGEAADERVRDALLALVALGHKQEAARAMVAAALKRAGDAALTVNDIVRSALGS